MKKETKRLKVAQITPYYYPSIGGVEAVVQYISEELVKRGHEVHVFTANRNHKGCPPLNRPLIEKTNGITIRRFKSYLNLGHMSFYPGIIRPLNNEGFDIIHAHAYRHLHVEISSLVGRFKNIPTILHGHGPFFSRSFISKKKSILYNLYDWMAGWGILKRIDNIIALTEYEKQHYIRLGAESEKITIIPNAADNECFKEFDPKPFIDKYGLGEKRIILYLSILASFKRPTLLVEALPKIIERVPNIFLLFVGPDSGEYTRIKDIGSKLNVTDYFKWIGPLQGSEKHQAFAAADFLILPSDEEPFGCVLVEAMAHGKPVIGSDAVGPSGIIENNKTGFIIKRGSVEDFANAAIKLLANKSLLKRMGCKAREVAVNKYSVSIVVDQIEQIYYELHKNKNQ